MTDEMPHWRPMPATVAAWREAHRSVPTGDRQNFFAQGPEGPPSSPSVVVKSLKGGVTQYGIHSTQYSVHSPDIGCWWAPGGGGL